MVVGTANVGMLLREVASGSLAAGFTATLFSPIECVKTRLQVQDQPGWPRLYRQGFARALVQIGTEDGILRLWSHGFAGFVGRDLLYSGLRIGLYPTLRGLLSRGVAKGEVGLGEKIVAGAVTGALGAAIANPLDVVRVRMSCEGGVVDAQSGLLATGMRTGHAPRWRSTLHCFRDCADNEGVLRGLWRGVGPTVARAALLSSGNLASYDHSKVLLIRRGWADAGPLHTVCAIISGLVATTACNPADVLKSALMSARASGDPPPTALGAASSILRTHGLRGFMRGWTAAYARAGPAFFIQMPIVELLRRKLGVDTL